eukprot:2048065-Prymnesium_polylepis.1
MRTAPTARRRRRPTRPSTMCAGWRTTGAGRTCWRHCCARPSSAGGAPSTATSSRASSPPSRATRRPTLCCRH